MEYLIGGIAGFVVACVVLYFVIGHYVEKFIRNFWN